MSENIDLINQKIAEKRASILAVLSKSGLKAEEQKHKEPSSLLQTPENSSKISPISLSLQQLQLKLTQATDPHLTEAYKLTQIVNKST